MAKQTVLIVEDDPFSRELVVDLLGAEGYQVLQATDGIGLVERVKREWPDLILLDIQLPGIDGFTLARQLKADPETRGIPLFALTAYARPEDQAEALEAGYDGYLSKPLDTKALLHTIARFLGSPGLFLDNTSPQS
ncbi:MAG: response regulator [candidate division NC10 bacterium]|nr:response regulator [candidate division NC10 bacterium]